MLRIDPRNLLWVLDNLADGRVVNQIEVPAPTRDLAVLALDRMLEHVASRPASDAGAQPVPVG
jgi:quinolinate synthase